MATAMHNTAHDLRDFPTIGRSRLLAVSGGCCVRSVRAHTALSPVTPENPLKLPMRHRLLTSEEENALVLAAQTGDVDAKQALVTHNHRMIAAMAHRYAFRLFPFEDAFQECALGFLEGVKRFDVSRGNKLSTYCIPWMRKGVTRAIDNQARLIRVPIHALDKFRRMAAAEHKLRNQFGRDPTNFELSGELGIDIDTLATQKRQQAELEPLSIDAVWGDRDPDENFGAVLTDNGAELVFTEMLDLFGRQTALDAVMAGLSVKEEDVLRRRFGLPPYTEEQSLAEIGRAYNGSREGIRQVEVQALKKCLANAERFDIRIEDVL